MKQKGTKNLTYTQRLQLEALLLAKVHKKEIAAQLGICLATVYNEISRGVYEHRNSKTDEYGDTQYRDKTHYSAFIAEEKYRLNCTAKGAPLKLGNDYEFVRYVEHKVLKEKLSPAAIAGAIRINKPAFIQTVVSKTTIYRYIAIGIFMRIALTDLPFGIRKRRHRKTVAKRAPKGTSIEKRPAEIEERKSFGHWEMDCVCGPTRPALLVLSERLTRKEIIFHMPNQKAESVIQCLDKLERRFGTGMFRKIFRSITVDNGSEFSDFHGIERSVRGGKFRTSVYYCHPYCSSERGTNERLNREIRRMIPKGSDLSKYNAKDIQTVENWVNDYPREIHGYATSAEVFEKELNKLKAV